MGVVYVGGCRWGVVGTAGGAWGNGPVGRRRGVGVRAMIGFGGIPADTCPGRDHAPAVEEPSGDREVGIRREVRIRWAVGIAW